jgi:di/tricarboxylate transporter
MNLWSQADFISWVIYGLPVLSIEAIIAIWVEYKFFKPADTKAMAKQVKKLIKEQLPQREAKKIEKAIDKAVEYQAEDK